MTDPEFDLLDELYFVTPFRTLLQKTGLPAAELENQLRTLLEQGLIRSYWPDPDTATPESIESQLRELNALARQWARGARAKATTVRRGGDCATAG